jgi:DNA polymerase-3 subunit gamma/tau
VRDGLSLLDQAIAQGSDGAADGAGAPIPAALVADMLGLADRAAVFDLMEAVAAGRPAEVLAITDRAHERGADLGVMLQDLLELAYTLTRLKAVPALRESAELPEAERTRGAALADALPVPALARLWQMLLKGIGEVEAAPDRRAAAEMVLIRLCYVADLPPPGELVRRLTSGEAATQPAAMPPAPPGGGARAVANGAPVVGTAPAPVSTTAPAPRLASFRDVVALVGERREAMLHAHLLHSVHLVRFAPPVIELRTEADTPRDLAPRLAALLADVTGTRWTIALSAAAGEPTLAEQGDAADAARRSAALEHPLVRAILQAFPGARVETVHDATADAYRLPAAREEEPPLLGGEPDMPDFAPPDAEPADGDLADDFAMETD